MGKGKVREVPASEIKNSWHTWLERVRRTHEEIVVTRYGQPVARLGPYDEEPERGTLIGSLEGTMTVHGDLLAPLDVAWDADA